MHLEQNLRNLENHFVTLSQTQKTGLKWPAEPSLGGTENTLIHRKNRSSISNSNLFDKGMQNYIIRI